MDLKKYSMMIGCILMTGCSPFSPVSSVSNVYVLSTPAKIHATRHHAGTLLVTPPETTAIYNTMQMAYNTSPYQIGYFVKSQWATTPSQMLQPLIVQAIQNSKSYRAVVTTGFAGTFDYVLNTQVTQFKQDFTQNPSVFVMTVRVQLLSAASGRVIRSTSFTVIEPAPWNTPYGGVVAANRATTQILRKIIEFLR